MAPLRGLQALQQHRWQQRLQVSLLMRATQLAVCAWQQRLQGAYTDCI
jgi:hypothetical protein